MELSASYSELKDLLAYKTGKDIDFEYAGNAETVLLKYMHIPCPSPTSLISGLFRRGAQALGNKALGAIIENFVNHPSISVNGHSTLSIDLSKIPQFGKALEVADIDTMVFNEKGVSINLSIKTCPSTE